MIIALVIVPTILLFVTSTLKYVGVLPVGFIGLGNFEYIFNDRLFWLSLQNTVIYTVGVTSLTFGVGLILALCLSRITKCTAIFRTLTMLPWAVPLVISGFIWKWIFNPSVGVFSDILMKLGLISSPLPVFSDPILAMLGTVIADAWVRIPFMCIFVLAGIESISQDLYDAAKIDGADYLQTFRYITLPLTRRMIFIGLLITSMFTFRTIDVIFSLTGGGPARATYVLGLYLIDQLWLKVNFGVGSATGVIMLLLITSFAVLFVRQILKRE
jgi:multiple sugar transport system permease protein